LQRVLDEAEISKKFQVIVFPRLAYAFLQAAACGNAAGIRRDREEMHIRDIGVLVEMPERY
jgi:hypothetical protein